MPRRPAATSSPPTGSQPQASRGPRLAASRRSIAAAVAASCSLRALVRLVVRQIGADHEQRVRPAPQALQHLRDLAGRRLADQERHEREVAEHGLEKRQLDLERMLRLVRRVRQAHLRQVADRLDRLADRAARRRAACERLRRSARRCRGTARSAPARPRPRGGSPKRRRRARRTPVRRPARSRRSRRAARSPLWARAAACEPFAAPR